MLKAHDVPLESAAPPPGAGGPQAVIHLGSNAITLLIGEPQGDGSLRPLEMLSQPVPLAQEVFRHGLVGSEAMELAIEVLRSHRTAMRDYGIDGPPARIAATNILLEAQNQDLLLNRISVALGWQADLLDDGEMTRLIYLAARRLFDRQKTLGAKGTLVSHIGPGNTRMLFFQAAGIQDYHRYPLGLERNREQVEANRGDLSISARMIGQTARSLFDQIGYDFSKDEVRQLVALGHEIQVLARLLGGPRGRARVLPVKKLAALAAEIEDQGVERLARRLQLDFRTADLLLYALELHVGLAQQFRLEQIVVPDEDFEESLLAGLVSPAASVDHFRRQVAQTALNLGRKFKIDTGHAQQVARLSATLFQELQGLHNLGRREALVLTAASLLHETGHLIGSRDHHLHSFYIIRHNEVFGLDQEDTLLAALVARYHRGPVPSNEHPDYLQLDRGQRLVVSKLAALLRVADSLDRGRGLKVGIRRARQETGRLVIELEGVKDTSAVQLALNRKAGLFSSVFGLDIFVEAAAGIAAIAS
jgi:exopolyphosphatase/guanosine-5'-triphosphate,3'-diphosphate pyrophosphatase